MTTRKRLQWTLTLVMASLPQAAAAEEYGGCFRVDLAAPYVLPDGSAHEAGILTVCTERPLSPSAGTHRMSASGEAVGRLVSRRVPSELAALDGPRAVFTRDPGGTLRLVGYAEPAGARVRAFAFAAPARPAARLVLVAAERSYSRSPRR